MTEYTEQQVDQALLTLVACGSVKKARDVLRDEHDFEIPMSTLYTWANFTHAERYNEIRDQNQGQLEAKLVADYRDRAHRASDVVDLAISKAEKRLKRGDDPDPARTAANLSTVADKMTRNMLLLDNRPTTIRDDRGINEAVRALVALGVASLADAEEAPAELVPGETPDE